MPKVLSFGILFFLSTCVFAADVSVQDFSSQGLSPRCSNYTVDFVGDITSGDASKLEKYLKSLESKFDPDECRNGFLMIRINSSGGDALEAIRLGRIIRKYNLNAVITPKAQVGFGGWFLVLLAFIGHILARSIQN